MQGRYGEREEGGINKMIAITYLDKEEGKEGISCDGEEDKG